MQTRISEWLVRLPAATRKLAGAAPAVLLVLGAALPGQSAAQSGPIVYPAQGQSMQQQAADEGECRLFAQQNTGFNPAQGPVYYGGSQSGGQVVGGAARGAALGAIGGAIGGDAGKGAAIGAGIGAVGGLLRRARQRDAEEQAQQQAIAQYNQGIATYNRAFAACMQGRGYTVN
ncbi:MAG: glycine zipper family protein [Gammaproteobacteria bacterium]